MLAHYKDKEPKRANHYQGKNISVIGAMALQGFLGGMTIQGSTNGDVFQVFVEKILVNCLWHVA
jgi:hypothetical protein